ncbi:N-acetyltransferase [bacterium]|nr:N-acetyltransferase [bacterium]
MNITIRNEREEDYREVETLTREAFWNLYKPGCDEHFILHKMRTVSAFVRELDFVACDNEKIVGNIVYSKAKIQSERGEEYEVLCMGPIAVSPKYQRLGIGSMLMSESIAKAKQLGYRAVVIFGSPDYYHRFGYKNASDYNIKTSTGENFDAFMVLEIQKGGLTGIEGKFYEDDVFKVDAKELEEFENNFPYKEKLVTDTQLR